jgi:thioredoxin-like negative regulator of GroEL
MEILKFSAAWCQPCKMLAKTLEGLDLPYYVKHIDIDLDSDLAAEYRVLSVPTMILVDGHGTEFSRLVGIQSKSDIEEWVA